MAALQAKTNQGFWQKIKNKNRSSLTTSVDGVNCGSEIVKMWNGCFKGIFKSQMSLQNLWNIALTARTTIWDLLQWPRPCVLLFH